MKTSNLIIVTVVLGVGLNLRNSATAGSSIRSGTTSVSAGGRSLTVRFVRAPLSAVRIKVGLAQGHVGRTESLAGIAGRYHAAAAVNGCFFDAYTSNPVKNPHHTLITNGELVHKGNVGTLLGFSANGEARMARVPLKIEGALNGSYKWPNNWYAYWINRLPESGTTITIFTPYWGGTTGLAGTQVVVKSGEVTAVSTSSQPIPQDGFVVYLSGGETSLASRFKVGQKCEYRIISEAGPDQFWDSVTEAIACGPRLVANGRVSCDPAAEGFSHPKVLYLSGVRSAVGLTATGDILLVTCGGATVRQMAEVMKALGAYQAMNLDGGASSGLWCRGKYLTTPGRLISNALLLLE